MKQVRYECIKNELKKSYQQRANLLTRKMAKVAETDMSYKLLSNITNQDENQTCNKVDSFSGLLKEKPTQTIDIIAKHLLSKRKIKSAAPTRFKSPAQAQQAMRLEE